MLADVIKQRNIEQQKIYQQEMELYNKPIKRETILYYSLIHMIGGIETWIYALAKRFELTVVYDRADKKQLDRLKEIGTETIRNVGQPIECDNLLFPVFNNPTFINAKCRIAFIHGMYDCLGGLECIPEFDKIYAVSKKASDAFYKTYGIKSTVLYNFVDIEIKEKPLIIGIFSRLSKEKGRDRLIYLLDKLKEKEKSFLALIFTDLPFEYDDSRVIFIKPELNPHGWMNICDYVCQLSDTEAGCLTAQESLKLGKPLIITKLPILDEFGINESNAKILEFDMSNLDVEDLWNIPVVKNWKEPVSKEWEDIMKKKVFREKYNSDSNILIDNLIKETGAKTIKIKAVKKTTTVKKSDK